MAPPIKRFEGASFVSTDIEATLHFWIDFVGGDLVNAGTEDGGAPWQVSVGGVVLDFYQATDRQQPAPGTQSQHYCWDCDPLEFDFWVNQGLQWQMKPKSIGFHHNGKEMSLYWDDPDGYHFEVASHFCTNVELMKQRAVRAKQFNALNALPSERFSRQSGPSRLAVARD